MTKKRGRPHSVHIVQSSARTDLTLGQFKCRKCGLRFESVMVIEPPEAPGEHRTVEPHTTTLPEPEVEIPAGVYGQPS